MLPNERLAFKSGQIDTDAVAGELRGEIAYSGIVGEVTVGETVTYGQPLYLDATADELLIADADAATEYPAKVISLGAGADGEKVLVLFLGYMRYDSWTWGVGEILYLSDTVATISATAPSTTGDCVQKIGYALATDAIYWNPDLYFATAA